MFWIDRCLSYTGYINKYFFSLRLYLMFDLFRVLIYSGLGLFRILIYSGFGLFRILIYSGFGLFRVLIYSGFWFIQGSVYSGFWFIQGSVYSGFWFIQGSVFTVLSVILFLPQNKTEYVLYEWVYDCRLIPQINMLFHSDKLSLSRSLFWLLNAVCLVEKQQISIL